MIKIVFHYSNRFIHKGNKMNRKKVIGRFFVAITIASTTLFSSSEMSAARDNPFTTPLTADEKEAIEIEKIKKVVLNESHGLREIIENDARAKITSLEFKLRDQMTALEKKVDEFSTRLPATTSGESNAATNDDSITESATFISCINGKALYRDSNQTLFQMAKGSEQSKKHCGK